jgi:hypothetical protein
MRSSLELATSDLQLCFLTGYERYLSRRIAKWCSTWPGMMNASARTVNGLTLATPVRIPGLRGQVLEERDGCETDVPEFFNMRGPGDRVGLRTCGCDILVVSGQWTVEGTGKPESSESECAFRIGNMIQNLADAPFAGSVSVQGSLFRD